MLSVSSAPSSSAARTGRGSRKQRSGLIRSRRDGRGRRRSRFPARPTPDRHARGPSCPSPLGDAQAQAEESGGDARTRRNLDCVILQYDHRVLVLQASPAQAIRKPDWRLAGPGREAVELAAHRSRTTPTSAVIRARTTDAGHSREDSAATR